MRNTSKKSSVRTLALQEKQQHKIVLVTILLFCLGSGVLIALGILLLFQLKIQTILCTYQGNPCLPSQQKLVDTLYGRFLFSVTEIADAHFDTKIQRKYPHTLIVRFDNPPILATVQTSQESDFYAVTSKGILFSGDKEQSSGIVDKRLEGIAVLSSIPQQIFSLYEVLPAYVVTEKEKGLISVRILDQQTIEWEYPNGIVFLTDTEHVEVQMRSLQDVMRTPTIDLTNHIVDVRFDHPVSRKK